MAWVSVRRDGRGVAVVTIDNPAKLNTLNTPVMTELIAAVQRLGADEALRGTLVLLLTAKAQESDVRRGYDSGADAYVKKPFSPAELSTRVRALLDQAAAGA